MTERRRGVSQGRRRQRWQVGGACQGDGHDDWHVVSFSVCVNSGEPLHSNSWMSIVLQQGCGTEVLRFGDDCHAQRDSWCPYPTPPPSRGAVRARLQLLYSCLVWNRRGCWERLFKTQEERCLKLGRDLGFRETFYCPILGLVAKDREL